MLRLDLAVPAVFILAAIFYALLGLYAWKRRPAVAVISFAWVMLAMSIWSFMYGMEIFLPTLPAKLFAVNLEYLGIASAPVFLFYYALDYTGRSHLITPRMRVFVWMIPILTLLLGWTNPMHHLMWDQERIVPAGSLGLLNVHFRIDFWMGITYSYAMFIASGSMLLMDFVQRPGPYRLYVSFVIFAMLLSFSGTVLFVAGISPIPNLDMTSLFFLPTGIGLAWITLRQRLSEILTFEYLTVLKNMKESVIVLNDEKRIMYINPVAERTINKTEDEAIGQPFEKAAGAFAAALKPFLEAKKARAEIEVSAGGEARIYEVGISVSVTQRDLGETVISLHDITERKERETELSRRGSIMSAISLAAEQFLKSQEWEKHIVGVLRSLGEAADVCRVHVVVNSRDGGNVIHSSLEYEWAAAGMESQLGKPGVKNVPMEAAGFGRWVDTLAEGRPIHGLVKDMPVREADFLRQFGSVSVAVVPIFVEYQWWGFLMFDECRREREWTAMELDAFHTAANILGAAEARDRTSRKLMRRQLSMSLLNFIVTASLQAETLNEMAGIVTDRLANLMDASGCFLSLWDEENRRTHPFASAGLEEATYPMMRFEAEQKTFTQSALDAGHTLAIEDVSSTSYADPEIVARFPSKSALVLPLIVRARKLGAIIIAFNETRKFTDEEIEIGEQAAALVALALEKFQAVEDARQRAATSETLRKAGIAVTEKLELDEATNHILDSLKQVVPYDSASVQLIEGDELVIVGGRGWKDEKVVRGMRFKITGDNPNSVVIQTGKPYRLGDVGAVYKKFREPPHDHIRSWLGVPLIAQEKTIGLLAIDSATPDDFDEREVHTALEFASQVAIALENARLFRESQNQAITDALTGVHNRRGIFQLGEIEVKRSRRIHRPISVMMLDIDHFKQVNDRYSHAVGDQVLRMVAQRCLKALRGVDLIGRYGGEEFIILLPETNLAGARIIGERLRRSIMDSAFQTDAGEIYITSSLGIAESGKKETLDQLVQRADAALYQAKNTGRNRVVSDDSSQG